MEKESTERMSLQPNECSNRRNERIIISIEEVFKIEKDISKLKGSALRSKLKARGYFVSNINRKSQKYTIQTTQTHRKQRLNKQRKQLNSIEQELVQENQKKFIETLKPKIKPLELSKKNPTTICSSTTISPIQELIERSDEIEQTIQQPKLLISINKSFNHSNGIQIITKPNDLMTTTNFIPRDIVQVNSNEPLPYFYK
ncbi:hypothetical protein QTN25_008061 [Entamoeba marina]